MAFSYRGPAAWLRPHPQTGYMGDGRTYGAAIVPALTLRGEDLAVIFSDGSDPENEMPAEWHGWEHVSVSTRARVPTWDEMTRIKALFWDDEDCVVQFHPPRSEYVDTCRTCLHLWRHRDRPFPRPPRDLVG